MLTIAPLHIIFYVFASIAILSGIAVITATHPVRSVLSLVLTFFAMSAIWMILQAEFLSLILLLVYVGAVMTLFLFVVMMLNVEKEKRRGGFVAYLPFGLLLVFLLLGLIIAAFFPNYFTETMPAHNSIGSTSSNIERIGQLLYTNYSYPFEIAGVILLAAIIAAITLAHRTPRHRKVQNPSAQIARSRADSVRLIKMPAENIMLKEEKPNADTN
jgi:NADH-quinone oxidoreductase subunit J